jgi:hypothetical protein
MAEWGKQQNGKRRKTGRTRTHWHTGQVPNEIHRYQIFAYASESHSCALGQVVGGVNEFDSWDLRTLNYNAHHYSHSREFRSNSADEHVFWLRVKKILLGENLE